MKSEQKHQRIFQGEKVSKPLCDTRYHKERNEENYAGLNKQCGGFFKQKGGKTTSCSLREISVCCISVEIKQKTVFFFLIQHKREA